MYWGFGLYFLSIAYLQFIANGLSFDKNIFREEESEICETEDQCKQFCLTKGCVLLTSMLLDNMKSSVDPCEDFNQFTCGGFYERNSATYLRPVITNKENVRYDLLTAVAELLDEPNIPGEPSTFTKVRDFYRTCMNTSKIEQEGSTPLRNLVVQLGGWPVISGKAWKEDRFDWLETMIQLQKLGINGLIFDVDINSTIPLGLGSVIQLRRPQSPVLINEMKSGLESEMVRNYYSYLVNMTVRLGAKRNDAERDYREVIRFLAIAEDLLPRNDSKYLMTVKKLNSSIQRINWLQYLNEILPFRITENVKLTIDNFNYFESIINIISRFPKRVIANYLMWRLVDQSIAFLSSDYINLKLQLFDENIISSNNGVRFDECLEETLDYFNVGLISMYTVKHFKKEDQKEIEDMVFNIQDKFRDFVKRNHWLEEDEKQALLDKLYTIGFRVGFSDALFNYNLLDQYYRSVKINPSNYLLNSLTVRRYKRFEKVLTYLKPQVHESELMSIQRIPLLQPILYTLNQLSLNTFGLHLLYYTPDTPKYIHYAIAGSTIGEQLFHMLFNFDMQNLTSAQIPWVTSTNEKPIIKGIFGLYQNLTKETHFDDFKNTLAAFVGFKIAYEAYKERSQKNEPEFTLPNIKQNVLQLLWIFNSQYRCSVNISHKSTSDFNVDSQIPEILSRLKEQLQILSYFNEDFGCSLQVNKSTTN